jgi:hypothetical protein
MSESRRDDILPCVLGSGCDQRFRPAKWIAPLLYISPLRMVPPQGEPLEKSPYGGFRGRCDRGQVYRTEVELYT